MTEHQKIIIHWCKHVSRMSSTELVLGSCCPYFLPPCVLNQNMLHPFPQRPLLASLMQPLSSFYIAQTHQHLSFLIIYFWHMVNVYKLLNVLQSNSFVSCNNLIQICPKQFILVVKLCTTMSHSAHLLFLMAVHEVSNVSVMSDSKSFV